MKGIAVVFCVVFFASAVGFGQDIKTVTNADLEKFRSERAAADREYRQTYAAKGLPSPEELRAESDERIKSTVELGERIRADQLEEARLALQAAAQQQAAEIAEAQAAAMGGYGYPPSGYGYPGYYPGDNVLSYGYTGGIGNFGYGIGYGRGFGRGFRNGLYPYFPFNGTGAGYASGGVFWPPTPGSINQVPRRIIQGPRVVISPRR